jgi:hypothetical protein
MKKNENFGLFLVDFRFRAERKKVTSQAELSRAELKILLLKLWLKPARLGLITSSKIQK